MRIYFDNIIFSILESGGISVVWQELLDRVVSSAYDYRCLEFNKSEKNIFRQKIDIPLEKIIKKEYCLFEVQRYINPKIRSYDPFIFHSSYYRTCSNTNAYNITTVHDFTYEYYAKGLRRYVHCYQKHQAIRNSDFIICISENTKKDLFKFLPDINPNKVKVIYNGVSDDYFILDRLNINELPYPEKSYFVFVGARDWYKRFDLAVDIVKRTNLNLVIVGGPLTNKEDELLNSNLRGRYKYVGRVSNMELNKIYNGAFSLLYTSEYEGFGIPLLEAQKAGCPAIALNTSSIPEVISTRELMFSKDNIEEVFDIISNLETPTYRDDIVKLGLDVSNKFSWNKMYKEIVQIYNTKYK